MSPAPRPSWLPDFCTAPALLTLVIAAELVALIAVFAPGNGVGGVLGRIGPASLIAQWICLTSAASLCWSKRWLAHLAPAPAALLALMMVGAVAWVCAWLSFDAAALLNYQVADGGNFIARVTAMSLLVAAAALRYAYVRRQWELQVQANARARVEALTARIRPHFLFNSMNTILGLITVDPERAERVVEDLCELFRAALKAGDQQITLADELALARRYLAIEQIRLGERLRVQYALEAAPADFRLPPLLLQPLVENAVYHGIAPLPEGGTVTLSARVEADLLILSVENPYLPGKARAGNHLAQDNIRQRLAYAFGPRARLDIQAGEAQYRCTLVLPLAGNPLS